MHIASSNIAMGSDHRSERAQSRSAHLEAWVGARRPQGESAPVTDRLTLSDAAKQLLAKPPVDTAVDDTAVVATDTTEVDPKLQLLKMVVEALSGHEIHVMSAQDMQPVTVSTPVIPTADGAAPASAGYGLAYDMTQTYFESETVNFSAQGVIKTTDGASVPFRVELQMHRELYAETRLSIREGDAQLTDPLVINFSGTAASLSAMNFTFDLNADGAVEQMAFPDGDSGLLALDRNGDGKITNGNELFGPKSGDAFAELAGLDDDHNGWIDEADAAFDQLRVWMKDAEKRDHLTTLREKGVGALYLGHARTPYTLKDNANTLLGQLRGTGLFLNNDLTLGSLQQLDLATRPAVPPPNEAA